MKGRHGGPDLCQRVQPGKGTGDHQMHVHRQLRPVGPDGRRLVQTQAEVGHVMPVHHIHVQHTGAAGRHSVDIPRQMQRVGTG